MQRKLSFEVMFINKWKDFKYDPHFLCFISLLLSPRKTACRALKLKKNSLILKLHINNWLSSL